MRREKPRWVAGNALTLLENGEAFFPRVFEAIARARREVLLETFILFEDKVGLALRDALVQAAHNGAQVDILLDGYGSPDLGESFLRSLTDHGVRVRVYDPARRLLGQRVNVLRRMHRKIVVVDGSRAFVGGINYSADHLGDFGPEAKQDYAVEIRGPLVATIHRFALGAIATLEGRRWLAQRLRGVHPDLPATGSAEALFATRDNHRHTGDIEHQYRLALRAARERIVIANAYFFPGYRLVRELRRAAARGVDVRLVLQGKPDMPIVQKAASLLYRHLLQSGVQVYEYGRRPLHGKVAVVDGRWATVGSSNLDPLSLSLNLEANVFVRDAGFAAVLAAELDRLVAKSCTRVQPADLEPWSAWRLVRGFLVYHLVRWYPRLATRLPSGERRLVRVGAAPPPDAGGPAA